MFTEYGCLWMVILAQNKTIRGISLALSVKGEGSLPGELKNKNPVQCYSFNTSHTLPIKTMRWVYKTEDNDSHTNNTTRAKQYQSKY